MQKKVPNIIQRIIIISIAFGLAIPLVVILVKNISQTSSQKVQAFFTPQQITYDLQSIFDAKLRKELQAFIMNAAQQKSLLALDQKKFYKDLKKRFRMVKSVEFEFRPPQTLHCSIKGITPFCRINDRYVLGNKRRLFTFDAFTDFDLSTLPTIQVNEKLIGSVNIYDTRSFPRKRESRKTYVNENLGSPIEVGDDVKNQQHLGTKLDRHAYKFIHRITPAHWSTYAITYHTPWNIELIPHTSICHCRIVTDETTFFDERKFDALNGIFNDLCAMGTISKRILQSKGIPLAFDFRIKDQIIVKFHEPLRMGRGL